MDSATPMNPALYRRLAAKFGEVRITHRGEPRVVLDLARYGPSASKPLVKQAGESYGVCCRFCRDRDFRLSVNHMYGQLDAAGRPALLAYCHAIGCLARPDRRQALFDMLDGGLGVLARARIRPG